MNEGTPQPSDEALRTLLDIAPDAIAIMRGPIILYMSPTGARMFGFESSVDIFGSNLSEYLTESDVLIATRRIEDVMRTRTPNDLREYRARRRDGGSITIEVAAVPIAYEGSPAVLSFLRDVTERKALEREVAESSRLAALGRLSAGVAHELNNPLTHLVLAVEGMRRLLSAARPDSAAAALARASDKLELIAKDVDRMVTIASELRLFASPQAGARRPVDLRQPIEDALRVVSDTHRAAAHVRVERRFHDVAMAAVDPMRIQQIFVNLLTNAFDSVADTLGPDGAGSVMVELCPAPDAVVVHVRDQGLGIPEDMLERVFEPFFTTKAYGRGAGLGLAISRSIVQALGGSLTVASEPGRGSTFSVSLPVWRASADPSDTRKRRCVRRLRVLVVDDEIAIGRALASFLEEHDVVVAGSAAEAEAHVARDAAFDVILCDVVMPGPSGVEFHRSLTTSRPHLAQRVIFMTGATLGIDDGRSLAALPNAILEKPFDLSRLERVLDDVAALPLPV